MHSLACALSASFGNLNMILGNLCIAVEYVDAC